MDFEIEQEYDPTDDALDGMESSWLRNEEYNRDDDVEYQIEVETREVEIPVWENLPN